MGFLIRELFVTGIFLISTVFSFTLDCDFRRECCWRSAEGEGVWETRKSISTNEFRRTFLVGKNSTPPDGPYVMRVETGAQEGGSSFMSCPFCSTSPVIVRYRHWQSPTAQVSLCWQLVVGQETQDEDQEECIQISANQQSNLAQQTLFVPVGKQIQLYFLIENVASKTYGVVLIDRIAVEYKGCKSVPSLSAVNLGVQHTAVVPVHRSSSSDFRKSRPKTIVSSSGNRKLKISKLTMQESALNDEVARQIRNLETTHDKDQRISSGNSAEEKHFNDFNPPQITSTRKAVPSSEQKISSPSSSQISSVHVVSRLTAPFKAQKAKNSAMKSTKNMKTVPAFHEAANRVTVMENTQRVLPSMATGMRGKMAQPPRPIPSTPALPPPPLLPTSLGKDFNPLHDLVGKEFSDFLDPGFVSKDDEEGDDPEAEEYFRQQKQKPQHPTPSTNVRQRSRTSQPTSRTVMQPQRQTQQQQIPTQPIRPTSTSNQSPLHPLFDRNQCDSPGGCLFERGLCSYTHATLDPNQMFRLTKVGLSSFALANVRPSSVVVLETPTNLREEHLIVLDVLERHADVSLRGCCQVIGQPQLVCPFSTPIESSVMIWQAARFSCPANTVKLVFMCENRGMVDGECGIDNLRLHLPSDILLWEPCQKDLLSQL